MAGKRMTVAELAAQTDKRMGEIEGAVVSIAQAVQALTGAQAPAGDVPVQDAPKRKRAGGARKAAAADWRAAVLAAARNGKFTDGAEILAGDESRVTVWGPAPTDANPERVRWGVFVRRAGGAYEQRGASRTADPETILALAEALAGK